MLFVLLSYSRSHGQNAGGSKKVLGKASSVEEAQSVVAKAGKASEVYHGSEARRSEGRAKRKQDA